MTKLEDGQGEAKPQKKRMWFGFGNYGGQPFLQIGGGYVRDPGPVETLFKTSKEHPWSIFLYAVLGLAAVMLLVMLAAWVISLFLS